MSSSHPNGQPNQHASQQPEPQQQVANNYQPNLRVDQMNSRQLPSRSSMGQYGGQGMILTTSHNTLYSQPQQSLNNQHLQYSQQQQSKIGENSVRNNDDNINDNSTSDSQSNSNNIISASNNNNFININPWGLSQGWFDSISRQLIEHMTQFGICVIDNFLGLEKGRGVLNEVEELYSSRKYSNGSLVSDRFSYSNNSSTDPGAIRNDRVIWVNGKEQNCSEINNLIQTLSSVITNSSTLSLYSNNELDKIVINKRTKAHVSCYPGNGTRYVKHVDNPNGDGRLITSIYYLNENWNTKREGGLLRMFPTGSNKVANIEPLFDRALFFWSDRRNPHEVLPAYRDRYAITVWFIGDKRA